MKKIKQYIDEYNSTFENDAGKFRLITTNLRYIIIYYDSEEDLL